jgi:hypothetical protein
MATSAGFAADISIPGVEGPSVWSPVKVAVPDGDKPLVAVDKEGNRYPVSNGIVVVPSSNDERFLNLKPAKKKDIKKGIELDDREGGNAIDVTVGGEYLTTYYYKDGDHKSYMWPMMSEGGATVTRDWPMGEEDRSKDHPHHQSFWTSYGDVNGSDYWEFGERTGYQKTVSIDSIVNSAFGTIDTKLVWQDKNHKPVVDEHRVYTFYNTPSSHRLFDISITLTANHGEVKFGDTKEGGLAGLRMADALREKGGSGTITNSAGGVGAKECWGKPAAWCDYSGTLKDVGKRGITIMDHPSSFRYPTHWHVRDYGLMGANAFGYSYFYNKEKNGEHTLKQGESISFNYRIYIHSGDVDEAHVAETYAAYVTSITGDYVGSE